MESNQIEEIKLFCESLHSNPNPKEVLKKIENGENDFWVGNVRFINTNYIQQALEENIASDRYILGCFTASAIEKATDWPLALIKAAQKGKAFQEIGEAMTWEHIVNLASIYAEADGYAHAFNWCDSSEKKLYINDEIYHVFDNQR